MKWSRHIIHVWLWAAFFSALPGRGIPAGDRWRERPLWTRIERLKTTLKARRPQAEELSRGLEDGISSAVWDDWITCPLCGGEFRKATAASADKPLCHRHSRACPCGRRWPEYIGLCLCGRRLAPISPDVRNAIMRMKSRLTSEKNGKLVDPSSYGLRGLRVGNLGCEALDRALGPCAERVEHSDCGCLSCRERHYRSTADPDVSAIVTIGDTSQSLELRAIRVDGSSVGTPTAALSHDTTMGALRLGMSRAEFRAAVPGVPLVNTPALLGCGYGWLEVRDHDAQEKGSPPRIYFGEGVTFQIVGAFEKDRLVRLLVYRCAEEESFPGFPD